MSLASIDRVGSALTDKTGYLRTSCFYLPETHTHSHHRPKFWVYCLWDPFALCPTQEVPRLALHSPVPFHLESADQYRGWEVWALSTPAPHLSNLTIPNFSPGSQQVTCGCLWRAEKTQCGQLCPHPGLRCFCQNHSSCGRRPLPRKSRAPLPRTPRRAGGRVRGGVNFKPNSFSTLLRNWLLNVLGQVPGERAGLVPAQKWRGWKSPRGEAQLTLREFGLCLCSFVKACLSLTPLTHPTCCGTWRDSLSSSKQAKNILSGLIV